MARKQAPQMEPEVTAKLKGMRPAKRQILIKISWERLRALLTQPGTLEVGFHPGIREPWRALEVRAAEAFTATCLHHGVRFATWKDVG